MEDFHGIITDLFKLMQKSFARTRSCIRLLLNRQWSCTLAFR